MISTAIALMVFALLIGAVGVALSWLSTAGDNGVTDEVDGTQTDNDAPRTNQQLIEAVNSRLPQTQCAQCGHPGCRPYAQAIIENDAPINQCPPGGDRLIKELAQFLGKDVVPMDTSFGETKPVQVAMIDEATCIGCTLCIAACPVDAIIGASRLMHTVISDQCTGCELCIPPCPVDCIELVQPQHTLKQWRWPKPA